MTVASTGPAMYFKQGFKPKDFEVGDKMQITWHPSKSGHVGGLLASMKLPDGRTFKDAESLRVESSLPGTAAGPGAAKQADTAQ